MLLKPRKSDGAGAVHPSLRPAASKDFENNFLFFLDIFFLTSDHPVRHPAQLQPGGGQGHTGQLPERRGQPRDVILVSSRDRGHRGQERVLALFRI